MYIYIYTYKYIYIHVYITGFAVDGAVGFAVHAVGLVVVAVMVAAIACVVHHSCAEQNLPVHAMHMSLHSRITLILPWP